MKLTNQVKIYLDELEKCYLQCDADTPLGQLYDYACAFKAFTIQKMQENQDAEQAKAPEAPQAPSNVEPLPITRESLEA